jgi:cobalt/nickel transport system permease protein
MGVMPPALPWAVHISDGVLTGPWLVGGFALAAGLALLAAYRVRDEEIPRIALLSAAFFVASLLHVRLGPTSIHLLLNGLVGVVLGRRAGLAIPLGLFLQAVLLGHGGLTTLGVNTCVLTVPALLAGAMFAELHRIGWTRRPALRTLLVGAGTLAGALGLVFGVVLVASNPWSRLLAPELGPALAAIRHPAILGGALAFALLAAWAERRSEGPPEFALGFLVGVASVLMAISLNALVLLLGGVEDWRGVVFLVFVAHLPVALIEGVVLGFTVSFLARVRPDLLGTEDVGRHWHPPRAEPTVNGIVRPATDVTAEDAPPVSLHPPALLLALLALPLAASDAHAHRLKADYRVLPGGKVQVECWFDVTGDSPRGAQVRVYQGGQLLAEERADDQGLCVFPCTKAGPLRVVVSAGAGHQTEFLIPADQLAALPSGERAKPKAGPVEDSPPARRPFASRESEVSGKDVLLGVTFLLALAAFVLSLRNARRRL